MDTKAKGRIARLTGHLGYALGVTFTVLFVFSVEASSAVSFCTFGSGPGQCDRPLGVAVDTATARVYVADTGNDRVNVFEEDGDFLFSFGSAGPGPGQFNIPNDIAIDNDPTSPAYHEVYVVDGGPGGVKPRVQRFSPSGAFALSFGEGSLRGLNSVAVGPGGTVYVGDNLKEGAEAERNILRFSAGGIALGTSDLPGAAFIQDLALDSGGLLYAARGGGGGLGIIEKYEVTEPSAALLNSFDQSVNTPSLAVDSADHLFAAQGNSGRAAITERDPGGNVVRRFGYGELGGVPLKALAVGASGDLFGSEPSVGAPSLAKVVRISPPPPGPLACCTTVAPGNTNATLKGSVNPEGKAATYHFEYITAEDYVKNGNSFTGPNPATKTPESAPVGSDFELYPAEAQIGCSEPEEPPQPSCLKPSISYRYRLVAKNADGEDAAEGQFETKPPFEVTETYATGVGTAEARIHASVNPLGIPATAYFEYVDEASYLKDREGGGDGFAQATKVPDPGNGEPSFDLGSGKAAKAVSVQFDSLVPGTAYRYRVVVADSFLTGPGEEHAFETFPLPTQPANTCPNAVFRTGPSAYLPDCRAYEMVSPVDKNGGDIKVLVNITNYPARLEQSSDDGNRFAYSSATAFADALSAPYTSEYLATRTPDGWSTEAINPPRESKALTDVPVRFDVQYKLFSQSLRYGWLSQDANPPLDDCAPEGFINLYRRDNETGEYAALLTGAPSSLPANYRIELQGISEDGTRAVFRANAKLIPEAANSATYQLYEHVGGEGCGELRVVSVMPDGKPISEHSSAGTPRGAPAENRENTVARAVSADGSGVFFSITESEPGPLYVRINSDREQSQVVGGKCTEAEKACTLTISGTPARFWTASTDGSIGIYSAPATSELFEYDVAKALAEEEAKTLIAGDMRGVIGASEDGSRIYFLSGEEIGGEGEPGKDNIYLYQPDANEGEKYTFVAATDSRAVSRYFGWGIGNAQPISNGSRLSPDGSKLAFVSTLSVTGYDNVDGTYGIPALEVYLYDADAGQVVCVSCNPTGSRPEGRRFDEGGGDLLVAAQMAPGESQIFAPRVLTEDGSRLFFESYEALLPRDTNGKGDVYGWQKASSQKECEENGAELYVESSGGCLSLISTGQSPIDSEVADVSPDGSNVFIRTEESLLPQDPGNVDLYDARVGGGFPQPFPQPAACEGEACQGPISPPSDPTPASLSFQGAGNVKEAAPRPRCRKGKVRRKGRCVPQRQSKRAKQTSQNRRAGR